jgi:hypothetical protein
MPMVIMVTIIMNINQISKTAVIPEVYCQESMVGGYVIRVRRLSFPKSLVGNPELENWPRNTINAISID